MKRWLLVLVALTVGCGPQRTGVLSNELTSTAHEVFAAAVQGDSPRVETLVTDSLAFQRVRAYAEAFPVLIRRAAQKLEVKQLWQRGDTSDAVFTVVTPAGRQALQMTFIRRGGLWRVFYLALDNGG